MKRLENLLKEAEDNNKNSVRLEKFFAHPATKDLAKMYQSMTASLSSLYGKFPNIEKVDALTYEWQTRLRNIPLNYIYKIVGDLLDRLGIGREDDLTEDEKTALDKWFRDNKLPYFPQRIWP